MTPLVSVIIPPVRKRSEELTQQDIGAEADFAFIDGDHSYEAVRRDFECILPMLSARALVALHDSTSEEFPGVSRFIGEMLATGQWFLAGNAGSLTCIRRGPLP
jgi:methyltransferase family protein